MTSGLSGFGFRDVNGIKGTPHLASRIEAAGSRIDVPDPTH